MYLLRLLSSTCPYVSDFAQWRALAVATQFSVTSGSSSGTLYRPYQIYKGSGVPDLGAWMKHLDIRLGMGPFPGGLRNTAWGVRWVREEVTPSETNKRQEVERSQ